MPYLFILLFISSVILALRSPLYAAFAALQIAALSAAIAGLLYRIPFLHRIAAPASALLVLNTAAICALYKFLFTRGPLWKIWTASKAGDQRARSPNPNPSSRENRPLQSAQRRQSTSAKTLSTDSQP